MRPQYPILFFLTASMNLLVAETVEVPCKNPQEMILEDAAQKSTYKNCQRNGMTWWFSDSGQIKSEVNFVDGKENGIYTSFHDNGQKKLVVNYTDGQKNGIQKEYYDNGQLGSEVNYVMGRREGIMTEWDYEGHKYSRVYYKNNYQVGIKEYYNPDGGIKFTEEYTMDRNPVVVKILKDKRKEIDIDLDKYGLMPVSLKKQSK
ncbi:MAG: toxin-antitoxin system YwqK family antitoxin [Campylobacterales bacterium]|nr:toxin-antitoxin system YwqK family antitoxin [Campylobacterales bacterium]